MHRKPFRFCPRCGTALRPIVEHGVRRRACPACGWIWYRNPVPAAGAILVRGGEVLLVKRRFEPRAGTWCLPAGFMEAGETPERTARREVFEETGYRVRLRDLFGVYAGFDDPRVRAVLVLYTAEIAGGRLDPGDDALDARWWRLARLPREISFESHRRALDEYRAGLR
uniref:NUDIX domain-containing protein n=1 Tax=Eiseniibacteriota bacterium TaxID=2212470 RepID=A0A832ML02_UNCEI